MSVEATDLVCAVCGQRCKITDRAGRATFLTLVIYETTVRPVIHRYCSRMCVIHALLASLAVDISRLPLPSEAGATQRLYAVPPPVEEPELETEPTGTGPLRPTAAQQGIGPRVLCDRCGCAWPREENRCPACGWPGQ